MLAINHNDNIESEAAPAGRNTIRCYCPKCAAEVKLLAAYSSNPRERDLRAATLSDLEALRYDSFSCPACDAVFELTFQVIAYMEPAERTEPVPFCFIIKGGQP